MFDEIKEKLTTNYKNEVTSYLNELKHKGFIIVTDDLNNRSIYHFSIKYDEYIKSEKTITSIIDEIQNNKAINYFDVAFDFNKYTDLIFDTLPVVTVDDLENFKKYNIALDKIKPAKQLKDDLKQLEKDLKQKQRKILGTANDDVIEQIQVLINNNIVCSIEKATLYRKIQYYQFNKQKDLFVKVSAIDMQNLFFKTFADDKKLDLNVIERNRKNMYSDLGFKSQLPLIWNANKEYEEIIKKQENSILNKLLKEYY